MVPSQRGWMWPTMPMRPPPHMFGCFPGMYPPQQQHARAPPPQQPRFADTSVPPTRYQRRPVKPKTSKEWTEEDDKRLKELEDAYKRERKETKMKKQATAAAAAVKAKPKTTSDEWTEEDDKRLKELEAEYRREQAKCKKHAWNLAANASAPAKTATAPKFSVESSDEDESEDEKEDEPMVVELQVDDPVVLDMPDDDPVAFDQPEEEPVTMVAAAPTTTTVVAPATTVAAATTVAVEVQEEAPKLKLSIAELTAETIKNELMAMAACPNVRKKRTTWSDEEDERLKSIVAALDPNGIRKCNWTDVARSVT
jgi:hypothetical protein